MTSVETSRVALIRFTAPDGTLCVGSGLLVNDRAVLTADHVADGSGHRVDIHGRSYDISQVLRSGSPTVDLAVLLLAEAIPGISTLNCARVDQQTVGRVSGCSAVGFPRWKRDRDTRRSAQIDGVIPTGEGLAPIPGHGLQLGFLTLVGNRRPARPIHKGPTAEAGTTAPWGGMSGAVVVAEERLVIGVVRSINLAGDGQSLTVTPLTAIDDLPDSDRRAKLWDALKVRNPDRLTRLPTRSQQRLPASRKDYEYDVYISYWPQSPIDSWVRNRFLSHFRGFLLEELGRPPSIFIARDAQSATEAIKISRVLLAVLSKQYFHCGHCCLAFDSMLQRQADEGYGTPDRPMRLLHAIVAHDFLDDEAVPAEYRGKFRPVDFKPWVYDIEMQDWQIFTRFIDAINSLAEDIAKAVMEAPAWRPDFPLETPVAAPPPIQRRPRI